MGEAHPGAALRHGALNPMRARLVDRAADWPWPSVHAHLGRVADDGITATAPVLSRYPDFASLLEAGEDTQLSRRLGRAETIGRPIGSDAFLAQLEESSGRSLKPARRGRPAREISALSP